MVGYLDLAARITIELDSDEKIDKRMFTRALQGMEKFCQTMRIIAKKQKAHKRNELRVIILVHTEGKC